MCLFFVCFVFLPCNSAVWENTRLSVTYEIFLTIQKNPSGRVFSILNSKVNDMKTHFASCGQLKIKRDFLTLKLYYERQHPKFYLVLSWLLQSLFKTINNKIFLNLAQYTFDTFKEDLMVCSKNLPTHFPNK